MIGQVFRITGATVAIGLMVTALWAWAGAWQLTAYATRPEVAAWAVRSAAVASAALAQLLILTAVARRNPDLVHQGRDLLRPAIGFVASIALVSAIALGLAGR